VGFDASSPSGTGACNMLLDTGWICTQESNTGRTDRVWTSSELAKSLFPESVGVYARYRNDSEPQHLG
jgi:hypothetical protein